MTQTPSKSRRMIPCTIDGRSSTRLCARIFNSTESDSMHSQIPDDDLLALHLQREPPFRALMRSFEHRLFLEEPIIHPVLDIGIGDGHFAAMAWPEGLDAGIDVSWQVVAEGKAHGPYRHASVADGTRLPYCDAAFRTVVSNCVMEHIPDLEGLVGEVARVLAPGGRFVFSAISNHFTGSLLTIRQLNRLGLRSIAERYGRWWNTKAVHFHFDDVQTWQERFTRHGLILDRHTAYMSAEAMGAFEVMHYYALPSVAWHKMLGRWTLQPQQVRRKLAYRWLQPHAAETEPQNGACSFFVAHKG